MKRVLLFSAVISTVLFMSCASKPEKAPEVPHCLQWWDEARFGMFIHWGVYAVPAGIDAGKSVANGAFACVVVPNVGVKASNPLNILKNTAQQQVVFDKNSQTLQFVAFEPCEIQLPWRKMTFTITKPGIGVVQQNAEQLEVVFTSSKKDSSTRKFTIQKASKISIK